MTKTTKGLLALTTVVFYVLIVSSAFSGEILLQTSFEGDSVGKPPGDPKETWQASGGGFEVSNQQVKEGKNSLGVLGGGGNQALAAMIETQSQVITAEFWLYVDGQDRSLTLFVQDSNSNLTDWGAAGPYVNWIGNKMRHYPGAWEEIGDFSSQKWHYVRLVVNTAESSHDIYVGDSIAEVHGGKPLGKKLGFRSKIAGPPGKLLFGTYDQATLAYVDALLIYEGDILPKGIFAVESEAKLTLTWGELKRKRENGKTRQGLEFVLISNRLFQSL